MTTVECCKSRGMSARLEYKHASVMSGSETPRGRNRLKEEEEEPSKTDNLADALIAQQLTWGRMERKGKKKKLKKEGRKNDKGGKVREDGRQETIERRKSFCVRSKSDWLM